MDSLAGHFLIASPAIMDPNFERAVVLVTAHTDQGAIGLILNRCSEATVGEAVPQLAPVIDMDEPLFVGGPVNPDGVAVLAEFEDPDERSEEHTSELQSRENLVCRLLLEKKKRQE